MSDSLSVGLKEYVDFQIEALRREIRAIDDKGVARNDVGNRELITARQQLEKRLESMNEFREQLRDQAGRFATADQLDTKIKALQERLERDQAQTDARVRKIEDGVSAMITRDAIDARLAALGERITQLDNARNVQTGRAGGVQAVFATVLIVIVIAGFVFTWFRFQPRP